MRENSNIFRVQFIKNEDINVDGGIDLTKYDFTDLDVALSLYNGLVLKKREYSYISCSSFTLLEGLQVCETLLKEYCINPAIKNAVRFSCA